VGYTPTRAKSKDADAVNLPLFLNTRCKSITLCGLIRSKDKPVAELLSKTRDMVASYRTEAGRVYLRIITKEKPGSRLHIDCATRDSFPKGRAPKTSHTKSEILNLLDGIVGSEAEVGVVGRFLVSLDEMPEHGLIRSLSSLETKRDGVGIRLTGGALSISGTPVGRIRWSILSGGKEANVEVAAERSLTVKEDYLEETLGWMEEQFQHLVLERPKDAKP
jgi:hypothetical protein